MQKNKIFLSTVAQDACEVAERYKLGLEIAEFCTASNMDGGFSEYDPIVRGKMCSSDRFVFHMAFNELSPAAIDPLVLDITRRRFEQALELSLGYGIKNMVVHSGYVPHVYYKNWFTDRSVEFWRDFLKDKPEGIELYLENVMEDEPELLTNIAREVNDPRFKLCLDVGHANIMTGGLPVIDWIDVCAPYLGHVHIHNNDGKYDMHRGVMDGTLGMKAALTRLEEKAPRASVTIEALETENSVKWLFANGFFAGEQI